MQRHGRRITSTLGVACLLGFGLFGGCAAEEEPIVFESDLEVSVPEVGTDEAQQLLRRLLTKGSQPGSMEPIERRQVEELVRALLPPTQGRLAGHWWEVKYLDLPGVDFVSAELMKGDWTDRQLWIQILPMGDKPLAGFEPGDLEPVGPYRARGLAGHHLFVRVGRFDVRIAADQAAARDDAWLREILAATRLDLIEAL